ncbi:MAG: TIGR03085 family metal-binding protein [Acidimicrobiales bacterium]
MAALTPSQIERAQLCDLLLEVGPDAPTLCAGWTTTDLAVHLVIRENQPLAGPGILLGGPFARVLESATARTRSSQTYEQLVDRIRSGPPLWWRPIDSMVNLNEYFVHHEDVRRGGGDLTARSAAEMAGTDEALWKMLGRTGGLMSRGFRGFGLDLVWQGNGTIHARHGEPTATLSGPPGEIVLYLMGRKLAAHVELGGSPEATEALRQAPFGV